MKSTSFLLFCICILAGDYLACKAFHINPSKFVTKRLSCNMNLKSKWLGTLVSSITVATFVTTTEMNIFTANAQDNVAPFNEKVQEAPLYSQRGKDLQQYVDINRGFKLLRPFGFNEFEGYGQYLVKFASLIDIDENVVIGSTAASAGKNSISDYGGLDEIGSKLAKKRGGEIVQAKVRKTEGVLFYDYEFSNPVDSVLPRPKSSKPTHLVELYSLCVEKGKLWSIQVTSNDKLFPKHEQTLRNTIASFIPRL